MARRRRVVVIGGGIAGLAAAYQLTGGSGRAGAPGGAGGEIPEVVVLEAGDRVGGKLRAGRLEGRPVDVGADSFLGRRPEALELCREIGLADQLIPVGTSGAAVWVRGRARPLPPSQVLGVPTRFWPTARSGILGPAGTARLLLDRIAPRPDRRGPIGDRSVGPLVSRKLGRRISQRLVDPVLGGIHAGGVADLSTAAVFPLLLAVAQRRGSLMRALRRAAALANRHHEGQPAFWSLQQGAAALPEHLGALLAGRGVALRCRAAASRLERGQAPGGGWLVHVGGEVLEADGVVLAVPAPTAASLLEAVEPEVATVLAGLEYASVALVTLAYPEGALPERLYGTGLLVPATSPSLVRGGEPPLVTAVTYLDRKWPQRRLPGVELLRASVGRAGDQRADGLDDPALAERVAAEVAAVTGAPAAPTSWTVTRWPDCLPQYRVHHLLRVAGVEAALRRHPGLAVAGAAYRGVGIPACIASGRAAAASVLAALAPAPAPG